MKKFLLILVFLMITNVSFAQKWECIYGTLGEELCYINKQNILIKGNILYCWIKTTYDGESKKEIIEHYQKKFYPLDFSNFSHDLAYWAFDISNNKIAIIKIVDYSSDGSVIESFDFSKDLTFDAVVPDSKGEVFMEVAKKYYNQKKKGKKQTVSK